MLLMSRPRFWLYTAGPYLVATAFVNPSYILTLPFVLQFLFFLLPANIFLYGINDFFDKDTDVFNTKKKQKEVMANDTTKWYVFASIIFFIIYGFYLDGLALLLLLGFFLLSAGYSAPPFRFKKYPFIDSISNILYIFPAFIAYTQHMQSFMPIQYVLAAWFWVIAMHLYSAIPDIISDKKAGLKTTAIVIGKKNSLLVCGISWFLASLVSGFYFGFIYVIMIILSFVYRIETLYWFFPYINAAIGMLLFFTAFM